MNNQVKMEHRIVKSGTKKLVGKRLKMSLSENKTHELWQSFMIQNKEINSSPGSALYSMQVYDTSYFSNFNPDKEFEKWAAIEVPDFKLIPPGLEHFTLEAGLYAVFIHKGGAGAGPTTFKYIFGTWLPGSGYSIDNRPHFELLGEKYSNEDPDSEEEIWIPIKPK